MKAEKILVIATRNKGKMREYQRLFKDYPLNIRDLSEFRDIPQSEEHGETFNDIAVNKARFYSKIIGKPVLADDSGLEVKALNNGPGIYSARYAGEQADDRQNNLKLVREIKGVKNHNAIFTCVIAISKINGRVLVYTGRCAGEILDNPRGENGFGYDPLFYYPPLNKTFAQLSTDEKNRVSHRGLAMKKMGDDLAHVLTWLDEP